MYKIYADDTLIYDSTIEDYKIGKGSVTLEVNKSGSFTFSLYPDHPFYDSLVKLKTVITVYKRGRILFRGRILNDVTDYWNNKVITCEGELGFLQDSIIRPFVFQGSPTNFFKKLISEHNAQVDDFKKFKVGAVTIVDSNDYIYRSSTLYENTLKSLKSRLPESALGGYFYITHGADGTDPIPTLNYVADFIKTSSQTIEFGQNLTKYTKTVKGEEIATAIIPLGATVDDGDSSTEDKKVTISEVNNGVDYVYNADGVALYGWIFKVVEWEDVTLAKNLKTKAEAYLEEIVKQNITVELTAVDLNLIDESIESFNVCEYIRVLSTPHNFDSILLCNKQTVDLLNPSKDSYVLGYNYSTFTEKSNKLAPTVTVLKSDNKTTLKFTDKDGTKTAIISDGSNGNDGSDGNDGVSPTIEVTAIEGGNRLTITDANGIKTVDIMNGQGESGEGTAGKDGVSPTVAVSKTGSVTTITITDVNGTKTATINDGAKGDKGDKGDPGAKGDTGEKGADGAKGADGYTPVKGTDYYTESDKTEMVNRVLAALPIYTGEVESV